MRTVKADRSKSNMVRRHSGKDISIISWKRAQRKLRTTETMWFAQHNSERVIDLEVPENQRWCGSCWANSKVTSLYTECLLLPKPTNNLLVLKRLEMYSVEMTRLWSKGPSRGQEWGMVMENVKRSVRLPLTGGTTTSSQAEQRSLSIFFFFRRNAGALL